MRAPHQAPPGGALACSLAVLGCALVSACGLNQEGVAPPRDAISFPASALVDPGGRWLYVVNSNSDLRYNNGTLMALDLERAASDRAAMARWKLCPSADYIRPAHRDPNDGDACCWDFLDHDVLDCDESRYIHAAATKEIGSFGSGLAFQPFDEPSDAGHCLKPGYPDLAAPQTQHECSASCADSQGAGRLFIGVRGNSSLTYVDTAGARSDDVSFSCAGAPDGDSACKVTSLAGTLGAKPTFIPDEPYALALDPARDLLYVGHLRGDVAHPATGGISLFDVAKSRQGVAPTFIGPSASVFGADGNGSFGVTSLTMNEGRLYASSRYTTSAVGVVVTNLAAPSCALPMAALNRPSVVATSESYTTPVVGVEIRGLQFVKSGVGPARAFTLQRIPPALVGFDIAGDGGVVGNVPTDILETCAAPTFLQRAGEGADTRLYVTCFESGQVYVFDPFVPRLTNVIEVGRGPAGLAFAPPAPRRLAYVVGFSSNNVSVVDLTPQSPTQYHVIQRLGFPSPVPR